MTLGAARVGERVLALASRTPDAPDLPGGVEHWDDQSALELMRREFPDLDTRVRGRRVLDFGCGNGWQSLALARAGARYVLGVDTNESCLENARHLLGTTGVTGVEFVDRVSPKDSGTFDIVISQNSFEHFSDPRGALREMAAALSPDGRLLITFGPPWLAPYGGHMYFFTRLPWVHLMFRERTVMRVRGRFRSDGAQHYEEVEGGLNRMTVAKFERLVRQCGLRLDASRYKAVKGLDVLSPIPGIRELVVNLVTCVLTKTARPDESSRQQA